MGEKLSKLVFLQAVIKVTVCLNSMHSKKKVVDKFGQKFSQILPFMYGSYHESHGFGFKLNAYFCIIYMSQNECRINFSYIFT